MTARTAALHNVNELKPIHIDSDLGIFEAQSNSSDRYHFVQWDPYAQVATCDCPAGTKGNYSCWHIDLVGEAWQRAIEGRERDEDTIFWVLTSMSDESLAATIRLNHEAIKAGSTDPKNLLVVKMGRRIWRSRRIPEGVQP